MSVSAPSLLHFNFPVLPYPDASPQPASEFRYAEFNRTSVQAEDFVYLASAAPGTKLYLFPAYEGWLHPVDGWMARFNVQHFFGYLIWGMGTTPSWIIMIVISFVSRQFMSKRMMNKPEIYGGPGQQRAPAAAPPPPAAAAAGRGTPGKKGGKKNR